STQVFRSNTTFDPHQIFDLVDMKWDIIKNFGFTLLWYCQLWTISVTQSSTGGGVLQIEWSYSNPESRLDNGNVCDRHLNSQCDVYFELCLRNAASLSKERCHLLQHVTRAYENTDQFSVTGDAAIKLTIPRPVPNSYTFEMSIRDEDYFPTYEIIGNFIAENIYITPNRGWKTIDMVNVSPRKKNPKLSLKVTMKLDCMEHFYGNHCMVECNPVPLKFECDINGNKVCFPGLTGPNCEREDSCFFEPCARNATCHNREDSKGRICVCNGRESPECYPDYDPCSTLPCQNGGECHAVGIYNESFRCNCTEPWTGHRCNERRLACLEAAKERSETLGTNSSEVCLNGGKCLEYTDKFAYRCHCEEGWSGDHCEETASKSVNWLFIGGISFFGVLLIVLTMIVTVTLFWRHRSIMRKLDTFSGRGGIIYYHNNRDSTGTVCSTLPALQCPTNELYGTWRQSGQGLLPPPNNELIPKGHLNGVYDECDPFGVYAKTGHPASESGDVYSRKVSTTQSCDQPSLSDSAPPLPERPQDLGLVTFRQPSFGGTPIVGSKSPYMRTYSARNSLDDSEKRFNDAYRPLSPTVYRAPLTFSKQINT
ncbi:Protein crumbs 1, partial [Clonorchis sinensis]